MQSLVDLQVNALWTFGIFEHFYSFVMLGSNLGLQEIFLTSFKLQKVICLILKYERNLPPFKTNLTILTSVFESKLNRLYNALFGTSLHWQNHTWKGPPSKRKPT